MAKRIVLTNRETRLRRIRKGWTQQELADQAGVGVRKIVDIEAGRGAAPEIVHAVAKALDTTYAGLTELPSYSNTPSTYSPGLQFHDNPKRSPVGAQLHVHLSGDEDEATARKLIDAIVQILTTQQNIIHFTYIRPANSVLVGVTIRVAYLIPLIEAFARGHFDNVSLSDSDESVATIDILYFPEATLHAHIPTQRLGDTTRKFMTFRDYIWEVLFPSSTNLTFEKLADGSLEVRRATSKPALASTT